MNLYSLLNIEHTSNLNMPNAQQIETILNEVISPELSKIKLDNKSKKYIWQGDYNKEGIKPIIQFSYRGTRGSFWIGINFKFIPFPTKNKALRYYSYNPHLFESKSYFDENTTISLWNEKFFRSSLQKYFNKNLGTITEFFKELNSIEANIEKAKSQIDSSNFVYDLRFPDPRYVLVYLYNKSNNTEEMIKLKTSFLKNNNSYNDSMFSGLD